jgi:hypothetical protein
MSEQQLKDFGAHAETLVEFPDFGQLERRGHETRVRRRAGVAAALAAVMAIVGVTVTQIHRNPTKDEPIKVPHLRSDARPYGAQGHNLDEGTYWLRPSLLDSHLVAEFTVPAGWDGSWVGPQNGRDGPGGHFWYTNALVMEVDHVGTHGCMPDPPFLESPEQVVGALRRAWSTTLLREPQAEQRFGFPATRMRLRVTKAAKVCLDNSNATYHATMDGYIPFAPSGTLLDIWVVDVNGRPIYVQRAHTPNTPVSALAELDAVIDSIQFGTR